MTVINCLINQYIKPVIFRGIIVNDISSIGTIVLLIIIMKIMRRKFNAVSVKNYMKINME